uniref:Uncharacterized protein n=1 Tax=Oncorhynchus tshawytscha TaxID=74940 RepID=A0A8C8HD90_ONCTS
VNYYVDYNLLTILWRVIHFLLGKIKFETSNLIVPPDPVVASAGDDIILPCHLSPQSSAVAMDIRWFKEGDFTNSLYLYKSRTGEEGGGYKGRVSLFTRELERGNLSLLLKNVKVSDRGRYKCQASHLDWIQEPAVVLQVTKQGSVPRISMRKHHRVFIQLSCSSENWFPEPDMLWTDSSGKEITSAETERPKQKEGGVLYSITSNTRIGMDQLGGVTCVVMSKDRGTKMESASLFQFFPQILNLDSGLDFDLAILTPGYCYSFFQLSSVIAFFNGYSFVKHVFLSVDVTLDPDTAHPKLTVSDDKKCVKFGDLRKERGTEKRFEEKQCVLGMEGYDIGTHYWEVDLGEKSQWSVGVAQDPENRNNTPMIPENGYWSIRLENGVLKTVDRSSIVLPIELKPGKLGVLVDYEEGKIVFFNVEKKCHIHSFLGRFDKTLYPFFGPLIDCTEELKISPIPQAEK